jgi:hypothetical protein
LFEGLTVRIEPMRGGKRLIDSWGCLFFVCFGFFGFFGFVDVERPRAERVGRRDAAVIFVFVRVCIFLLSVALGFLLAVGIESMRGEVRK